MNIIVWHCIKWRPTFVFDIPSLRESLLPGFKIVSTEVIGFAEDQAPRLLIGSVSGSVVLGYYAFATRMRYAIQDILCNPSLAVLYPAMTQLKGERDKQTVILGYVIEATGWVILPVVALAAYEAPLYVPLLLGEKWNDAIPVLQAFILGGAGLPIIITVREALRAYNKIGSFMKVQIPVVVINLLILVILLPRGLAVTALGLSCWTICSVPIYIHLLRASSGINLWNHAVLLYRPVAAIAVMIMAMSLYQNSVHYPVNMWARLFSSLILGGGIFLSLFSFLQFTMMGEMLAFVRALRASKVGVDVAQS